jgi:hypothetical protein
MTEDFCKLFFFFFFCLHLPGPTSAPLKYQ